MFNKNVFTQKDPIADLVKPMLEAQAKAKMEELKGNQKVLDKNKNNKLDSQDFKILRGEKKVNEEEKVEEGWDDMMKAVKDRSGPQPSGGSGVKKGRAYGGAAQKSKPEHDDADDKKKTKNEEVELDEMDKSVHIPGGKEVKAKPVTAKSMLKTAGKALHKALTGGSDKDQLDRLRKNMYGEEAESIEERSLTSGEKAEMEKNVKGMKKNLAGFKARYGDRAKSVMYATATKQAKKD